jgi:small multidrug resistance pump
MLGAYSRRMSISYVYLALAILAEVAATTALTASQGLTRPGPVAVMALGYAIAFVFLALSLKTIPVGVAYAIWSGVGVVLITGIGWALFRQTLEPPALAGIGLILAGVVVLHLYGASHA